MSLREMEKVLTWEEVARATAARTGQQFTEEEEEALCGNGGAGCGVRSAGTTGTPGVSRCIEGGAGRAVSAKEDKSSTKAARNILGAKSSKFRNVRVKEDGHTFDSQKELDRWHELLLLQKAGMIRNLVHHRRLDLRIEGLILDQKYEADFSYEEHRDGPHPAFDWWFEIIEDVKPTFRDEMSEKRYKRLPHYRLSALKQAILRMMGYDVREV